MKVIWYIFDYLKMMNWKLYGVEMMKMFILNILTN